MIPKIVDDKRKIQQLVFPDGEKIIVGKVGVEKIMAYSENEEGSLVTWFAIFIDGIIAMRVNSKFVESIGYATI